MRILSRYDRKSTQRKQMLDKDINSTYDGHIPLEKQSARFNNLMRTSAHQECLRILLVILAQPVSTLQCEIAAGTRPEIYNYAIQKALGTDMLNLNDVQSTYPGRLITRLLGPQLALAWTAFRRHHAYDIIFTTNEIVGLPLAMFLKLSGAGAGHPRHVTLSHYLSPLKKRIFFKFGAGSHIDTLIVHCAAQQDVAINVLRSPDKRVIKLPYFVDTNFWRPITPPTFESTVKNDKQLPMICAVGLEFRDHATLVIAVSGLNVEVRIAAAGNHTTSANLRYGTAKMPVNLSSLPPNVLVRSYNYVELRELYTAVLFIVVPLRETEFQAGVTSILEAMAMGKAVIVSGTQGQTDVVRDPRNNGRGFVVRKWWPGFLEETPDVAETLGSLPTGLYVTPGDPDELHDAIQYLLDHPEVAEELGRNGQHIAEAFFNLNAFVQRFATAILGESHHELEHLSTHRE